MALLSFVWGGCEGVPLTLPSKTHQAFRQNGQIHQVWFPYYSHIYFWKDQATYCSIHWGRNFPLLQKGHDHHIMAQVFLWAVKNGVKVAIQRLLGIRRHRYSQNQIMSILNMRMTKDLCIGRIRFYRIRGAKWASNNGFALIIVFVKSIYVVLLPFKRVAKCLNHASIAICRLSFRRENDLNLEIQFCNSSMPFP